MVPFANPPHFSHCKDVSWANRVTVPELDWRSRWDGLVRSASWQKLHPMHVRKCSLSGLVPPCFQRHGDMMQSDKLSANCKFERCPHKRGDDYKFYCYFLYKCSSRGTFVLEFTRVCHGGNPNLLVRNFTSDHTL
jgi:hypothetical protein